MTKKQYFEKEVPIMMIHEIAKEKLQELMTNSSSEILLIIKKTLTSVKNAT